MRVDSKNIGVSLIVASMLMVGCSDKDNNIEFIDDNNTTMPIDENLTLEDNSSILVEDDTTTKSDSIYSDDSIPTPKDDSLNQYIDSTIELNSTTYIESNGSQGVEDIDSGVIIPDIDSGETNKEDNGGIVVTTPPTTIRPPVNTIPPTSQTPPTITTPPTTPDKGTDNGGDNQGGVDEGNIDSTTPTQPTQEPIEVDKPLDITVKGSVVDGAIYGGRVSIYDMNKKLLGSSSTNAKGAYSIPIPNLPKLYRVEVDGGRDSGVDGVANSNDRDNRLTMSAIVDRDESKDESIANVSPATTLVDTIVEDGTIPLDEARDRVDEALGLDSSRPLCKIDPTKNENAYRAGLFLAMVMESIATDDKRSVMRVLSKVVVERKIKIKISNIGTTIERLDLVDIATRANIAPKEIDKLTQTQTLITDKIKESIDTLSTIDGISSDSQSEAVAQRAGWDRLIDMVQNSDDIDSDRLAMVVDRLQDSMRDILSTQGLEASEPSNIALISDMIDKNLDRDIDTIKIKLKLVSRSYIKHFKNIDEDSTLSSKKSLKLLIAKLYTNTTIDRVEDIDTLLDSDSTIKELDDSAKEIDDKVSGEADEEQLKEELIDTISSGVASRVESGEIPTSSDGTTTPIKSFVDRSLADDGLYESIKSVVKIKIKIKIKTTRLTKNDRAELQASIKVKQSLKVTIKSKEYTKIDSSATADMLEYISSMLNSLSDDAYRDRIHALELSLSNLTKAFDKVKYESKVQESIKVVEKIKSSTTTNIIKTIIKIKVVIKEKFIKESVDTPDVITDIDDSVGDYSVGDDIPTRVIRLPQPKIDSMGDIDSIRFVI